MEIIVYFLFTEMKIIYPYIVHGKKEYFSINYTVTARHQNVKTPRC